MLKTRVYELARELGVESKALLAQMKELNIVVVSHQSTLDKKQVTQIEEFYRQKRAEPPPQPAKPKVLIRRRKKPEQVASKPIEPPTGPPAEEPPPVDEQKPPAEEPPVKEQPPEPVVVTKPSPVVSTADLPKVAESKQQAEQTDKADKKTATKESTQPPRDYGKVNKGAVTRGTSKVKRSATIKTRDFLRSMDDEDTFNVDEYLANRGVKNVYTPKSSRKREVQRKKNLRKTQITTSKQSLRIVKMGKHITVSSLARQLRVKNREIIKKLKVDDVDIDNDSLIDFDSASLVASEYDFEVQSQVRTLDDIIDNPVARDIRERPPVITVMGHVDHGKTSILDTIRKTNVADGEAGGITQHIGAYTVDINKKSLTFLDTPGHEAFTAMRVRGAQLTDIVILVVAADDGVMPQTIESISHARNAEVPVIVALNKIDKPDKNLDRIFSELAERGVQVEKWGGDVQCVEVSAKENIGIGSLLEAVLLQAEMMELRAPHDLAPNGVVIEAHLDKQRGAVATVLVQRGVLKRGDFIVTPSGYAKVRAMTDHRGRTLDKAEISTPVQVLGFSQVPNVGDRFDATRKEKTAKEIIDWHSLNRVAERSEDRDEQTLDSLLQQVTAGESPTLAIIIKADTQGSAEAIASSLSAIDSSKVNCKVVHQGVGGIIESDVVLATASNAIVIGFNVRAHRNIEELARQKTVTIKYFSVIYEILDNVRAIMAGLLPTETKEVIIGHAEVRNPINVPKIGMIAGSAVTSGKITRDSYLRLLRDSVVIHSGRIGSLRRFKEDVKEVSSGYECGIGIDSYQDIKEGDIIEAYLKEESATSL